MSFKRSTATMSPRPPRSFTVRLAAPAMLDATSKEKEVDLKLFLEEMHVMTADLSLMDDAKRAWFEATKKSFEAFQTVRFVYNFLNIQIKYYSKPCVRYFFCGGKNCIK
jgi:hypothetical protein